MEEVALHAVGQMAELLNRTTVEAFEVHEGSYGRVKVAQNILFSNEEVQLVKKKLLKILSEI